MSERTKGKWEFNESDLTIRSKDFDNCTQMGDYQGCVLADLKPALGTEPESPAREHAKPETLANAKFICLAVNYHDKLVEALKEATNPLNFTPYGIRNPTVEQGEQLLSEISKEQG